MGTSRIAFSARATRLEGMSLFWRVVAINAAVVVAAVLVLIFTPARVSSAPTAAEIEVLIGGTLLVIALNVVLLRRVFGPLERLTGTMRRVDPHDPGRRVTIKKPVAEVAELARAFNDMLDRLEDERRGSARRALAAQEGERLRVARELHDEVGQTLTGVVLALEGIHRRAPDGLDDDIADVQEAARAGVEQVREIARGLRPGPLEELGPAQRADHARDVLRRPHRPARAPPLGRELPPLSPEQDLAVYRVAQESLTNVARHARARTAELELSEEDGARRPAGLRRRLRHPGAARRVDRGRRRRDAREGAARRRPPARARAARARNRSTAGPVAVPLKTRILLADDHTVVRRGLRMVLDAAPDLTVVAEAGDGIEAVERGLREPIDLAVIDVAMPRAHRARRRPRAAQAPPGACGS